jgi:hypothetical protein
MGAPDVLRPDAAFLLDVPAGPIHCVLEWDRSTETQARLAEKLDNYRISDTGWRDDGQPTSVLFVVPSLGRVKTLRRALMDVEPELERRRQDRSRCNALWPLVVTTVDDLRERGMLGRVWESIPDEHAPLRALTELPTRFDLGATNVALALGREWRHDQAGFWDRLSPLHRRAFATAPPPAMLAANGGQEESWVVRYRQAEMEEIRREVAERPSQRATADRLAGALNRGRKDGLMNDDLDDGLDGQEESWA